MSQPDVAPDVRVDAVTQDGRASTGQEARALQARADTAAPDAPITLPALPDLNADLGLGGAVAEGSAERFLNKDGSFSARRQQSGLASINVYGELLTVGWGRFFTLLGVAYLGINAAFAGAYYALGPSALSDVPTGGMPQFLACFFFSVQTFGTIGFGHVYPKSVAADWVVTVEAFVGLLGVALSTGILFARFSRPSHRVLFSDTAVVAPYQGGRALMFRVTNGHRTQLIDLNTEVTFARFENVPLPPGSPRPGEGQFLPPEQPKLGHPAQQPPSAPLQQVPLQRVRRFYPLQLERSRVTFFPTSWTVVHPITPDSPLWRQDQGGLVTDEAELLVVMRATDDASQQHIHARSSYTAREIVWDARFVSIHSKDPAGHLRVNVARLSETEPVVVAEAVPPPADPLEHPAEPV